MITLDTILKSVCAVMDLQPEQVLRSRYEKGAKKDLIRQARQVGMFLSRSLLREEKILKTGEVKNNIIRWQSIGAYYLRVHSSVMHDYDITSAEIQSSKACRLVVTESLRLLERVNEVGESAIRDYKRDKVESEFSDEIKSLLKSLNN